MTRPVILKPDEAHLHGATLAHRHLKEVVGQLSAAPTEPTLFIVDFKDVTSVTASYLRATLLWAILCGQAEMDKRALEGAVDPGAIRPIPLYAAATNCSVEIVADIHDFFSGRDLPLLEILEMSKDGPVSSRILGRLDTLLFRTLQQVASYPNITALELSEKFPEKITVNGWSNRLSDLYRFRLLTRKREGKFWRYAAIIKSIIIWA